ADDRRADGRRVRPVAPARACLGGTAGARDRRQVDRWSAAPVRPCGHVGTAAPGPPPGPAARRRDRWAYARRGVGGAVRLRTAASALDRAEESERRRLAQHPQLPDLARRAWDDRSPDRR